jgi:predicted nucleotidyltransferase
MLTQNDIKITEFLVRNPNGKFSIREISRQTKIDYKLVHNSVGRLVKKKIIDKKRYGRTQLCEINLREAISDLIQVESIKAKRFLEKNVGIKLITKNIKENIKNPYCTLLLFGSYAKDQQHYRSDLDLIIIVPGKMFIKEAETALSIVSRIKPIKIHSLVFTADEFKKMLTAKEELNAAKETLSNHILFYGAEAYYQLLKEI